MNRSLKIGIFCCFLVSWRASLRRFPKNSFKFMFENGRIRLQSHSY
jgi:hypothetical protein